MLDGVSMCMCWYPFGIYEAINYIWMVKNKSAMKMTKSKRELKMCHSMNVKKNHFLECMTEI